MEYILKTVNTTRFSFSSNTSNQDTYTISPKFGKKIDKINEEDYLLTLSFSLHSEDNSIAPYEVDLVINGIFSLSDCKNDEIDEFMNKNAVAILFPYLRSILSTALSAMMIQPLILPLVDAYQLFHSKKDLNEDK